MQVRSVNFLVTFRCPSKCEHCVYNASPEQMGRINLNDVEMWLRELKRMQWFEGLTLHGGEPFLFPDEMKAILKMAKELAIPKRGAITNGYWARTPLKAMKTLKELTDADLNRITFSVDGFHQRYIAIENVKLGIKAAISLGIERVWVDSYYLESVDSENVYDELTKSSLREIQGINGVEYSLHPVDFEGRGAKILLDYTQMSSEIPSGNCILPYWIGGDLQNPEAVEIDFEGNITLCPGICIGNAKTDSLSSTLDSYTYINHPIIRVLVEEGPIGLHGLAIKHRLKPKSEFVNECQLCYEMRKLLHAHYPHFLSPGRIYH
ncbi:MAG: radical SAM protein [Candidatus Sifarchaeia archaeon]